MMSDDGNDGQMIVGDVGGLKLPDICLTGEEKPRKNSPKKPVPTGDRTRARCVTGEHAAAYPLIYCIREMSLKRLEANGCVRQQAK